MQSASFIRRHQIPQSQHSIESNPTIKEKQNPYLLMLSFHFSKIKSKISYIKGLNLILSTMKLASQMNVTVDLTSIDQKLWQRRSLLKWTAECKSKPTTNQFRMWNALICIWVWILISNYHIDKWCMYFFSNPYSSVNSLYLPLIIKDDLIRVSVLWIQFCSCPK